MNAVQVLMEARDRIERGWCQQACARDEGGDIVWITSGEHEDIASVCVIGSLMLATKLEWDPQRDAEDLFLAANGIIDIPEWNDDPNRTKAEVLEAFDNAIALGLERMTGLNIPVPAAPAREMVGGLAG